MSGIFRNLLYHSSIKESGNLPENIMNKMTLEFLANASTKAIQDTELRFKNTCTSRATIQCTAFSYQGSILIAPGNLHDTVDASHCIEFDIYYKDGNAFIRNTRQHFNTEF